MIEKKMIRLVGDIKIWLAHDIEAAFLISLLSPTIPT